MLNLEELVFKVKTDELVDAVAKVKQLGTEVANLAKPIDKAVSASDKLSKAQQQEATTAAKAAKATADLAAAETKAGKARGEAAPKIDTVTRSIEKQLTAMKVFRGEAINAADGAIALGTAFTKTQANQLAALKVSGATTEALKTMARSFEEFNKITSANTFDNSVAGIQRLRKEIAEMSKVDDLMRQGIKLTQDEIVNLVRDSERLTQQFKSEGLSAQQLDAALAGLTQEHVLLARQKNDLVARSKESERQAKAEANAQIKAAQDQARAVKYLEDTERRMAAAVDEANRGLDRGATDTLVKYKQALMQAGLAADVAEGKMATLKSQMDLVASRKRADELRYLSRALSVQMGDVAISLASGMNPLLVMIQQGDQIRGVLDQVGAQGDELRKSMTGAAAQIAAGMKNTAIAIGTFLGGAFLGAGKYLNNFVAEVTGADKALLALKARVIALDGIMTTAAGPGKWVTTLRLASAAVVTFGGLIATTGIAALGAWAVGLYKVIQEENALAKQLALTGNAMGLSFDSALRLSRGMSDVGVSTGMAMKVLGEMAKVGGFVSSELQLIAKSATDMKTYFGVAIEDTVKAFAKMKKEPVEAMFELAKTTGMVSSETIKAIVELKEQGKTAEATALAIKTLASVNAQQVEQMKKDYNGFSLFMIELGKNIKSFYDEIFKSLFYKADPKKQLQEQIGAIEDILSGGGSIAGALARTFNEEGMKNQLGALKEQLRLMTQASDAQQRDAAARAKEQANYQEALKLSESLASKQVKLKKELLEAEQKFKPLVDSGLLSQEKYNAILAGIRDKYKEVNKEANQLQKYTEKIDEKIRDLSNTVQGEWNEMFGASDKLTKSQKLMLDILDDPLFKTLPEKEQARRLQLLAQNHVLEEQIKLELRRREIYEDELRAANLLASFRESSAEDAKKAQELLDKETRAYEFKFSLIGKTASEVEKLTRQYERNVKLAEIENKYISQRKKLLAEYNNVLMSGADQDDAFRVYNEAIRQSISQQAQEIRNVNAETALLAAQDYERAFKEIQGTITDIIATALFEGGKAGQKKLKDVLKNAFRNFVLDVVINPIVRGGMNAAIGAVTGTGSSSVNGIGAMIGEGFNDYVSNTAIGAMLTSTGGYAAAIGGGSMAAGSQAAMLAAQTSGFGVAGTALTAQAAGGAAGAVGGAYAGVMNALAAIPVWGWIAMAVVALLGSGFGTTPGEQHIGGMYSTRGSDLNMDTARAITGGGGWDDGAWARDLTERGTEEMGDALKKIVDGALGEANAVMDALGIGNFTIDAGFAANLNGEGTDKNAFGYFNLYDEAGNLVKEYINRELGEDLEQAIAKFGGDIQEAVSSVVLAGTDFQREGETNVQTIGRLANSLIAVNQVAELLGMNTLDLSLVSGDAASSLVDLFGSIENLKSASQSFYDQFANDTIKLADAQRLLDTTFAKLGLSVPKTKDEYFQLVQGLDLTTEAGRNTYVTLLGVSDAFLYVNQSAKSATESIDDAYSALEAAVEREQEIIAKRISTIEATRNALSKLFDVLSKATRELYGSVSSTQGMLASQGRDFIRSSLASARSGGPLPDADKMQEAIGSVRTGISDTLYATRFEQERDTLILAGELFELQGYAENELSNAELQLKELKEQSEQFDLMLAAYKTQIEIARGIDTSILSVAEAINNLTKLLFPEDTTTGTTGSATSGGSSGGSGGFVVGGGGGGSSTIYDTEAERLAANIAAWEATGKDWKAVYLPFGGLTIVGDSSGAAVSDQEREWLKNAGVPGFANGGAFTNGIVKEPTFFNMAQMGEAGSEAIMPLTNIGGSLGVRSVSDPSLVEAIANTNANLEMLRTEIKSIAISSDKTRRLLERVTQDGNSLLVTDVTPA